MGVDVIVEDLRWRTAALEALAGRAIAATLRHVGVDPEHWEVAVMGCDDARIAALNAEFRAKTTPTNVLSWPAEPRGADIEGAPPDLPEGAGELGDIAVSYETCLREAEAGDKPLSAHAAHLIVHGTLHLLGYDHIRDGDGDLMESVEIAILEGLGVPNPYEGDGATGPVDVGKGE